MGGMTPGHELTVGLPAGAAVYGDKAYNSKRDEATIWDERGVRLAPIRRANMAPNRWAPNRWEEGEGRWQYRKGIESVNSQLTAWGIQRRHARTNAGFMLKVHATLLAVALTNAD